VLREHREAETEPDLSVAASVAAQSAQNAQSGQHGRG